MKERERGAVQVKETSVTGQRLIVPKGGRVERMIDYILFRDHHFRCLDTLQFPTPADLEANGCLIPSRYYPSDHFQSVCRPGVRCAVDRHPVRSPKGAKI